MCQYRGDWPIKDIIKHYLQSKGYQARKKAKIHQTNPTDNSAEENSDDEDQSFNPHAALEKLPETSESDDNQD
jgi:hypothetical protein